MMRALTGEGRPDLKSGIAIRPGIGLNFFFIGCHERGSGEPDFLRGSMSASARDAHYTTRLITPDAPSFRPGIPASLKPEAACFFADEGTLWTQGHDRRCV
jgi:hypothetical protein